MLNTFCANAFLAQKAKEDKNFMSPVFWQMWIISCAFVLGCQKWNLTLLKILAEFSSVTLVRPVSKFPLTVKLIYVCEPVYHQRSKMLLNFSEQIFRLIGMSLRICQYELHLLDENGDANDFWPILLAAVSCRVKSKIWRDFRISMNESWPCVTF